MGFAGFVEWIINTNVNSTYKAKTMSYPQTREWPHRYCHSRAGGNPASYNSWIPDQVGDDISLASARKPSGDPCNNASLTGFVEWIRNTNVNSTYKAKTMSYPQTREWPHRYCHSRAGGNPASYNSWILGSSRG